jgi:hypothetical protein
VERLHLPAVSRILSVRRPHSVLYTQETIQIYKRWFAQKDANQKFSQSH